ncbi:hypothetical protein ACIQ9R_36025 [Streptomyces sp. NPDC094447]|uniref:hypothetical protein n=1 Tax=Streptomyces sp. NPDC094447 TaxID=3366062 RepID=UPI003811B685
MIKGWGKAASVLLAASAVVAAAGCGEGAGETGKAAASTSPAPSVPQARKVFEEDLGALAWDGCPDDCARDLDEVVANARVLRKAMNADAAGPGFWGPAYKLIDEIEAGRAKVEGDAGWNRALVLKPAHALEGWLAANPAK